MPIDKDRDDKLDKNKHSDTNKLPDESDTDHADCSSEDGSLNKQSLNDADYSVDSGHDSDCISKPSTLSDASVDFSSENDSTSDSNDFEHPLNSLSSRTSNDSDYVSMTSGISDATSSSHYFPKNDSVSKKGTTHLRADHEKKTKSSENFVDRTLESTEIQRNTEKLVIPSHKIFNKEELTNIEREKRGLLTQISKHLLRIRNSDYTNDTDYTDVIERMSLVAEKLERLKKYPAVKYLVKEFEAELIKLAATSNAADSIAAIKGYLEYLKSELAAGRLADDHLANKNLLEMMLSTDKNTTLEKEIINSVYSKIDDSRLTQFELDIVSDISGHQSNDDQFLEYLRDSTGKTEKYSTLEKIKECKRFQNQMDGQEATVMFSLNEGSDGNGDQGDQADNQGNGTNIPADMPEQEAQGNPQAAELPENIDTSNHQPYYQGQEYSSVLAIQEEGARGTKEKVLQAPKRFSLPEKSELVTSCSHPYHTAYHVEDQHVTLTQYQQFSEILAAKGVSEETIMKFIYTGARYVPILHYRISELLSPIVVVIDNAGRVFEMENIWKGLPAVIEQVLMMLKNRPRPPIPVTETGDDDLHVRNRPHDGGLRNFPPETTHTTSFDQPMAPVDSSNNFQVTTNPLQDTDIDLGDVDIDDIRILYEYHHSADAYACYVIEAETFQLHGYCCCMCGITTCQGERIAMEMRTSLHNARCCICIQRNELLTRLTTSVNFNTRQNCIPGILRIWIPHEILQRNVALGCLDLRRQVFDVSHNFLNPTVNPISQCSVNSFINLHCRNLDMSSIVHRYLSSTIYPTSLMTSEGAISLINVQNLIDRLCSQFSSMLSNQSILQPFIQATSRYLSSGHEYIKRFLSNLPHSILQNSATKLSISMTVVPDGVPIDMDQLNNGLLNSRVALRYQDSITSSLHLPPGNAFSNIPIIVNWTVTIQSSSSSLSFLQVDFDGVEPIDPVEAVNLHGRDSLVAALQPTYDHHGDEANNNFVQPINSLVEDPIFDPNDSHKKDIFSFPAENSSYEYHHPSDNDTITNNNQVNCEPEEATISDDSSESEAKMI